MVFDLMVPELGEQGKSTKDAVVSLLVSEWPLSSKKIFFHLKKNYNYHHSYQAVFKAIGELVEKNVLMKKGKDYEVNIDWIKKLQSFTDIVETNYYAKNRLHELSGIKDSKQAKDLLVLNFETIFDVEKYLYYLMKTELFKIKSDTVCCQVNNEWRPIFYLRAEHNYHKRLMGRKHKFYTLCSGNSAMEKLCANFYLKEGVHYKFVKSNFASDVWVFGDYFVQVFIPAQLREDMKKLLLKKDLIGLLTKVLEKKSDIRVVVSHDKNLSQEMKKQILQEWKISKK